VASRLSRQEIKHVCDDLAVRIGIEGGRRMRAVSDDRLLARRRSTMHGEDRRSEADEVLLMAGTWNLVCEMHLHNY
jgi:hypothetical protein